MENQTCNEQICFHIKSGLCTFSGEYHVSLGLSINNLQLTMLFPSFKINNQFTPEDLMCVI